MHSVCLAATSPSCRAGPAQPVVRPARAGSPQSPRERRSSLRGHGRAARAASIVPGSASAGERPRGAAGSERPSPGQGWRRSGHGCAADPSSPRPGNRDGATGDARWPPPSRVRGAGQVLELHVFYVPAEVWNFKLNTVPVALTSKFVSAGFIRVSPHLTLRVLRERLGEYLGAVTVADKFIFLKCIGKKLAVVKAKQETELELKYFAPPYALYPELYLLPGVDYFEDVYPLLSSPQQKHHISEEANNRFGHGSRLSSLSQQKPEKGKPFLESVQSRHQVENLEVPSPVEWGEKEPVPISHTNNKQDNNNRIPETQFEEKDQSGSDGSLFTPSRSNPADQESGKCDVVLHTSEQNHLSQHQEDCSAPKWNDKAKGTAPTHVNHSDEQGQGNQRPQNHIKYQKELANMENNEHQKDTKLRRDQIKKRTQDAEVLKIREDQTTDYVHRKNKG
ncbi:spermatogenesis-associated protein 1 isoform 2-T2 [Geothlypis trichas]